MTSHPFVLPKAEFAHQPIQQLGCNPRTAGITPQLLDCSTEDLADTASLTSANCLYEEREILRHILLGNPSTVRQTIQLLHRLRYVELIQWSPIVVPSEHQISLTLRQGEAMSLLVRHLRRGDSLS